MPTRKTSIIRSLSPVVVPSLLTLIAGCTVGPDYVAPKFDAPAAFAGLSATGTPNATITTAAAETADAALWWTRLGDAKLAALIEKALDANHDVRLAVARLDEVRALYGVAKADQWPQVNASADASRYKNSEKLGGPIFLDGERSRFEVGLNASWELDFFGRVRRGVEAAQADLDAGVEGIRDARVLVASEVALAYTDLRGAQARLAVAQRAVSTRNDSLGLAKALLKAGLSSEFDVAQAEGELASRRASVPAFEAQIAQACHRVALLLGQPASALYPELLEPSPIPTASGVVAVGTPSELLRRRPDIRRAERQIAAANARIGVATGELYPKFSLLGSFSLQASNPDELFDLNSRAYSFGPSASWSVFNAGRVRSNIDAADARTHQALLTYERTVLGAIRDAEDSLISLIKEQSRLVSLKEAVVADQRAVDLATSLFKSGLSGLSPVLDNQRRQYDAEDQVVLSELAVAQSLIRVYKSLGGGWQTTRPETSDTAPAASEPTTSPTP
ncbi:MAG: efflux transporter outer membrane subunit [Planctomycetota bacterium]